MSQLPLAVKQFFKIPDNVIIDFYLLDTSCNFKDVRDQCTNLSLITQATRAKMEEQRREYHRLHAEVEFNYIASDTNMNEGKGMRKSRKSRKSRK